MLQRTKEWFAARRGKLTASNLGAALGQVSYTSRAEALRRALGTDKFEGNAATNWGTEKEDVAIAAYSALTGNRVTSTGLHVHKDIPWLGGSPDGLVGALGMVEIKCPYYHKRGGRVHQSVPGHYFLQVNALLEICEREWCDFVSWAPEGMAVHRVYRDSEVFEWLLPFYTDFFHAIERRAEQPPPLPPAQKYAIAERVNTAIAKVSLHFWNNAHAHSSEPEPEPYDALYSDEDAALSAPAKRQRAALERRQPEYPSGPLPTAEGQVAGA